MELLGSLAAGFAALGSIAIIFGWVSSFFIGIALWIFDGFTLMYQGRKAGLDKDWMVFVPFAKTIYKLKITGEQWWKMFIFQDYPLYAVILFVLILAISAFKWMTLAVIVVSVYLLAVLAYNVYWRYKFFIAFDVKPHLALCVLIPVLYIYLEIMDILIAFTNNYDFGGTAKAQTVKGAAQNFVNVPQSPQMAGGAPQPMQVKPGTISGLSGMYAGQSIPLAPNEPLLIGRDGTCHLIIDKNAEKLSRKHCSIMYNAQTNSYMVTDYSSNGTYIDGGNRLVANMATQMQCGTVIALGNRENTFRLN